MDHVRNLSLLDWFSPKPDYHIILSHLLFLFSTLEYSNGKRMVSCFGLCQASQSSVLFWAIKSLSLHVIFSKALRFHHTRNILYEKLEPSASKLIMLIWYLYYSQIVYLLLVTIQLTIQAENNSGKLFIHCFAHRLAEILNHYIIAWYTSQINSFIR